MRRPPYISFERPNHLRDLWDKLRIPLLQLWIFPKIMPWPLIRIQPPSKIERILPWFPPTNQISPIKGQCSLKRGTERWNAPLEEGTESQLSLTVCRGVLPSKFDFWVDLFSGKRLVLLVNWFLFFKTSLLRCLKCLYDVVRETT